jgi:hypothetical protein
MVHDQMNVCTNATWGTEEASVLPAVILEEKSAFSYFLPELHKSLLE